VDHQIELWITCWLLDMGKLGFRDLSSESPGNLP
jgi:hypothetical protein